MKRDNFFSSQKDLIFRDGGSI